MSPTCAKCGAFGGYEREACGFPLPEGRGGGICDGRVFTDKHELQRAKEALWWESCLAKEQAKLTRLRVALASIAALQTEESFPTSAGSEDDYKHGVQDGEYKAAEIARAALGGGK